MCSTAITSHFSQIDSSEDEDVVYAKKAMAKKLCADREAKRKQKHPSQAMGQIKDLFGISSSKAKLPLIEEEHESSEEESKALLEKDASSNKSHVLQMNKTFYSDESDDSSLDSGTEDYDMAYQEASKSGMNTSTDDEETDTDRSSQVINSTIRIPQYETSDIFQTFYKSF